MADHSVGIKSAHEGAGRGLPEKASPLGTPEPGLKEPGSPHAQQREGHLLAEWSPCGPVNPGSD